MPFFKGDVLVKSVIEPKKNILEKRIQNNDFPKIFILTLS